MTTTTPVNADVSVSGSGSNETRLAESMRRVLDSMDGDTRQRVSACWRRGASERDTTTLAYLVPCPRDCQASFLEVATADAASLDAPALDAIVERRLLALAGDFVVSDGLPYKTDAAETFAACLDAPDEPTRSAAFAFDF
jgi:hypothetical protein